MIPSNLFYYQTPMYDKYDEIQFIINLLLLNDKKSLITNDLFTLYLNEKDTKKDKYKKNIIDFTTGYISYIKGNDPLLFFQKYFIHQKVLIHFLIILKIHLIFY